MDYFLKVFLPRALQDGLTALATILMSHGFITKDQEQGFIGAAFFLAMIIVNAIIARARRSNIALKAGMAVADMTNDVSSDTQTVQSILHNASVK